MGVRLCLLTGFQTSVSGPALPLKTICENTFIRKKITAPKGRGLTQTLGHVIRAELTVHPKIVPSDACRCAEDGSKHQQNLLHNMLQECRPFKRNYRQCFVCESVSVRSLKIDFTSYLVGGRQLSSQTSVKLLLLASVLSVMEMTACQSQTVSQHEQSPPKPHAEPTAFTTANVPIEKQKKKKRKPKQDILRHGAKRTTTWRKTIPRPSIHGNIKQHGFCFLRRAADTLRGCTVNLCGPCLTINTSDILWPHIDPTASPDMGHQTVPHRSLHLFFMTCGTCEMKRNHFF